MSTLASASIAEITRSNVPDVELETALGPHEVAELADFDIARMSHAELVEAIRAARLPILKPERLDRLIFSDRPTLERLLHLARRCCRHQIG